jgi:hypothetical protein
VAIRDELTALQLMRDKVAELRTQLLIHISESRDALGLIEERIGKLALDRRMAVLRVEDLRKSAQNLSTLFSSSQMPDSVRDALTDKECQIEDLGLTVQVGDERQKDLKQLRNYAEAACRLAQRDLEGKDAELALIDQKIAQLTVQ